MLSKNTKKYKPFVKAGLIPIIFPILILLNNTYMDKSISIQLFLILSAVFVPILLLGLFSNGILTKKNARYIIPLYILLNVVAYYKNNLNTLIMSILIMNLIDAFSSLSRYLYNKMVSDFNLDLDGENATSYKLLNILPDIMITLGFCYSINTKSIILVLRNVLFLWFISVIFVFLMMSKSQRLNGIENK